MIDVNSSGGALVGSPTVPATGIEIGLSAPMASSVYFLGANALHHAPIDKRLGAPIASQTTTRNGVFEDRTTGVIFLAK